MVEILDIGSGSGILGLLVARDNPKLSLNQSEIQEEFQFLSQINSKCNKIEAKMYKGSFLLVRCLIKSLIFVFQIRLFITVM